MSVEFYIGVMAITAITAVILGIAMLYYIKCRKENVDTKFGSDINNGKITPETEALTVEEDNTKVKAVMPNKNGTYAVVIGAKTREGYDVNIGIPSAEIEDISPYKDLIVDEIPWMAAVPEDCLMKCEVSDE